MQRKFSASRSADFMTEGDVTYCRICRLCKKRVRNAVATNSAERHVMVMNPFWYCGASTVCHTIRGSQACSTYAISFMEPMTSARSSLSSAQISCAHLKTQCQSAVYGEQSLVELTPCKDRKGHSRSPWQCSRTISSRQECPTRRGRRNI